MRVNKYLVKLDNGEAIRISGATSEADAQRLAELEIKKGKPRHVGATVEGVQLCEPCATARFEDS